MALHTVFPIKTFSAEASLEEAEHYLNQKNYFEAANLFHLLAEEGLAQAQYELGYLYLNGRGVSKDVNTAVKLFQLAADQGHLLAQAKLGEMYSNDESIPRDDKEAAHYCSLAAEQGEPVSQYTLGLLYYRGQGVERDYRKAANFYQLAADQNYAVAQRCLAELYAKGEGVKANKKKKLNLYHQAAAQGDMVAQYELGFHYSNVYEVPEKAFHFLSLAAEQGHTKACYELSILYFEKNPVIEFDLKKGMQLCQRAAKQGSIKALQFIQQSYHIQSSKIQCHVILASYDDSPTNAQDYMRIKFNKCYKDNYNELFQYDRNKVMGLLNNKNQAIAMNKIAQHFYQFTNTIGYSTFLNYDLCNLIFSYAASLDPTWGPCLYPLTSRKKMPQAKDVARVFFNQGVANFLISNDLIFTNVEKSIKNFNEAINIEYTFTPIIQRWLLQKLTSSTLNRNAIPLLKIALQPDSEFNALLRKPIKQPSRLRISFWSTQPKQENEFLVAIRTKLDELTRAPTLSSSKIVKR